MSDNSHLDRLRYEVETQLTHIETTCDPDSYEAASFAMIAGLVDRHLVHTQVTSPQDQVVSWNTRFLDLFVGIIKFLET